MLITIGAILLVVAVISLVMAFLIDAPDGGFLGRLLFVFSVPILVLIMGPFPWPLLFGIMGVAIVSYVGGALSALDSYTEG